MRLEALLGGAVLQAQLPKAFPIVDLEGGAEVRSRPLLRDADEGPGGVDHQRGEVPAWQHLGVLVYGANEAGHLQQRDGAVTRDDEPALERRVLAGLDVGFGDFPHVDHGVGQVGDAHAVLAAVHCVEHMQAAGNRVGRQGRTDDQARVDDHEGPAALEIVHLPGLSLSHQLGVGVGVVVDAAALVPARLDEGFVRGLEHVGIVAVHGGDLGREHVRSLAGRQDKEDEEAPHVPDEVRTTRWTVSVSLTESNTFLVPWSAGSTQSLNPSLIWSGRRKGEATW